MDDTAAAQIAAAERLRDGFEGGAQLTGGITQDEIARLQSVEAYLLRFYEIKGCEPDAARQAGKAQLA